MWSVTSLQYTDYCHQMARVPPAIASPARSVHDPVAPTSDEANRGRTMSQSITDTMALATGHFYDNVTALADTVAPMMGLGGDGEFKKPLQRSDSLGVAMGQADNDDEHQEAYNQVSHAVHVRSTVADYKTTVDVATVAQS